METASSTQKKSLYKEYKGLNLPEIDKEILSFWKEQNIFKKSIDSRSDKSTFVFYEGPPSANGMPGIHHVMARTIKDLFCRYKTLKGFQVKRKGGWDTHGLPVELGVEKSLGITKEDIGTKISIEDYNKACRTDVMKFKDSWDKLTQIMGYWVDLDNPYITFENNYIESVWWLLKQLFEKNLLYKGYTIQPYSPAAGTGLSSHELNLPGCYKNVKDTSVVAQFKIKKTAHPLCKKIFEGEAEPFFLAWTTTPWTLPSNAALAVGANIIYVKVKTFNPYTFKPVEVLLAEDLVGKYFSKEAGHTDFDSFKPGDKQIPWVITAEFKGKDLAGIEYEQLLPYVQPSEPAFKVIVGDFVSTEDGTGIVHIAPTFGADDQRVAKQAGIPPITVKDENGKDVPLVNKQGKFVKEVTDFADKFVKDEYEKEGVVNKEYKSVDVQIAIKLKEENKAFKVEKYEHSYPHCWRTDKPILYYPLDSWFIKTTAVKDRLVELNKQINWKPASTGTGRFGNWLENLVDWNLSRSRYWGIPLPVWMSEDKNEIKCIGSAEELRTEVKKSVEKGFMKKELSEDFDLHRPYVDDIILVSDKGQKMFRETDLIDVWFDSGAMPYAQLHYPFENKEEFKNNFPADYIAEGVDQTRGWFFTLHAIAGMLFDSVAYKNVVSNGLVLDKNGNKMSKRLGNAVDPFETLNKYGADATRWYMIVNAPPWDNLKFDVKGIEEVQRKFFGTLFNTYSFFTLYANIDQFSYEEKDLDIAKRPEMDRWILSLMNTLIKEVEAAYEDYEPTKAARAIQEFVTDHLSNWYVRLGRRRYWKGEYSDDKTSAYQTLYQCLITVSKLMSPIAPFFSDFLYRNLNNNTKKEKSDSVHISDFPKVSSEIIDKQLEERMQLAQDICSLVFSLRKKENIKVRQPLQKIIVPVLNSSMKEKIEQVKSLVLSEINVKELEYLTENDSTVIKKKIKPNFKLLGTKMGAKMKAVSQAIGNFKQEDITTIEKEGSYTLNIEGESVELLLEEVEIISKDIPGWMVASNKGITVALDITITDALKHEGNARELVNRIQNLRKEKGFEVTDRIKITIEQNDSLTPSIESFKDYISREVLAKQFEIIEKLDVAETLDINNVSLKINIEVA